MKFDWTYDRSQFGQRAKPTAPFEPGRHGRYELLSVLGQGGMGAVYRARDLELRREVALKFLLGDGERRLKRFREREGVLTAALRHPHVVAVHSSGELAGVPYIEFELVPGARTLDQVWPERDLRGRLELVRDAAKGLAHAHEQGVLHRDVKPSNVLVGDDGRVRVADFGLGFTRCVEPLTESGALIGTPYYMAPEVLSGLRNAIGAHTDVWSLGMILYQAIAGRLPFEAPGLAGLITRVTTERPTSPRVHAPGISRALEAVCLRALATDPARRYRDCGELAEELTAVLEGRSPRAAASRRRHGVLIGAALLIVVGAAVLAASTQAPGAASPSPLEPAAATSVQEAGGLSQGEIDRGSRELETVRLLVPLEGRLRAATTWLERYPAHPEHEAARQVWWEARRLVPLFGARDLRAEPWFAAYQRGSHVAVLGAHEGRVELRDLTDGPGESSWQVDFTGLGRLEAFTVGRQVAFGGGEFGLMRVPFGDEPEGPWLVGTQVYGLALSADERVLAVAGLQGGEGRLLLLDPLSGSVRESLTSGGPGRGVTFAGSERLVSIQGCDEDMRDGQQNSIGVWSLPRGEPLDSIPLRVYPRCLAASEDGRWAAVGTSGGQLYLLDLTVEDPQPRPLIGAEIEELAEAPAHQGSVRAVAFSPDGARLYSGSTDRFDNRDELRVWCVDTGKELYRVVDLPQAPISLSVSSDGRRLLMGTLSGGYTVWQVDHAG